MNTVQEYKEQMIAVKENEPALDDLNSTSKVSIWNLLLYIVSVCFVDQRTYFNTHSNEVDESIYNGKYGTLAWYRTKALAYQSGFNLLTDSEWFDSSNATDEEIEESKIIKYAAVNKSEDEREIIIKIASESNGILAPINSEEVASVKYYFEDIKVAGTPITIINYLADRLYLIMKIQVNPLLFDTQGMHKASGEYPVQDVINTFLKELPFDGELILQDLEIAIREIKGIEIAEIIEAKSSWINGSTNSYELPTVIDTKRIPVSGYFQLVDFDSIEYYVV